MRFKQNRKGHYGAWFKPKKNLYINDFFFFFAKSKKLYFEFFGGIIPKMRFFPKDPTLSIFSLKAT